MTAASEARRAVKRRRIKRLAVVDGVLLSAGLLAAVIALAVDNAPSVQARELPQPPKVTQPAPVAGPVQPIFDFADMQPWDPGKEPVAVVVSQPVRTSRSAARIAAASAPRQRVVVPGPVSVDPQNAPAPTQGDSTPPPNDDPLTDDGMFGDGCEQPGTPPRCDPDVPPVGLPPVVVPPAEDETQPAEETPPAEEEPPVDEVEVVDPATEVAAP